MEGSAVLTIDIVRKSLENYRRSQEITHPAPLTSEATNKAIRLDRNFTLRPGWEQCLDTKTGKIYYVSEETGVRVDIDDNENDDNNITINGETKGKSIVCAGAAPTDPMGEAAEANNLLLLVTCKRCIMYMMVSKATKACPRCGGALIQFIDEKCF